MKKILISLSVGLALLASSALPASAATLTTSQIQAVISLLQAFGVDTTTIANVQATLNGAQTNTTATIVATTTPLTSSTIGFLHMGDRGDRVKFLQTILAADPSIYPDGLISGFFGQLTQEALKHYQRKHGREQVGFVGPKTLQDLDDDLDENPMATENDNGNATSTISIGEDHICAIVPPGHLIAPGWMRHHDDERPTIPTCQTVPPGIKHHFDDDEGATTTPPILDKTAPTISAVSVGSVASTSARVAWVTNEPATSKVYFGTSTPLVLATAMTVTDNGLLTAHALTLSPLTASTTYYYAVESRDALSNTATTSQNSFTTLSL